MVTNFKALNLQALQACGWKLIIITIYNAEIVIFLYGATHYLGTLHKNFPKGTGNFITTKTGSNFVK